eukprot:gene3126-3664_t
MWLQGVFALLLAWAGSGQDAENKDDPNASIDEEFQFSHSLIGAFLEHDWLQGLGHWDFGGSAVISDREIELTQ